MADYDGNGLAAFNDARSRGWSGSVTLADLEKLSAGNPIMQGIAAVWPDAPPSRADQAYQTSIDRWKQLGKDVFFAPANGLKAFNENPTFMNSLGIMPMGTFGGQLAKTADRVALASAQRMLASGASKEAIWDKTGWFQGVDKKWRFEIPDNASKWNLPDKLESGQNLHVKSSDALYHPELSAAYPETGALPVQYVRPTNPTPGSPFGIYAGPDKGYAVRDAGPFNDKRSTALHELQHHIQGQEGFARGANPRQFSPQEVEAERQRLTSAGWSRREMSDPSVGWVTVNPSHVSDQDVANMLYRRSAGEVEARAVQNRMGLTPEQARTRYPWLDWDVPAEQQIVK